MFVQLVSFSELLHVRLSNQSNKTLLLNVTNAHKTAQSSVRMTVQKNIKKTHKHKYTGSNINWNE